MVDDRFGEHRAGRRLRALAAPDLADDEALVNWSRVWTSRDGRYNVLLAARHRDFIVLTTRRVLLWSCGFFSRRPRRKVFDEPRDRTVVEALGPRSHRRLRVEVVSRRPLRFDFASDAAAQEIVTALLPKTPEDGTPEDGTPEDWSVED